MWERNRLWDAIGSGVVDDSSLFGQDCMVLRIWVGKVFVEGKW